MGEQLRTYEFRCRGIIKAESEDSAKIALNVSNVVMTARVGIAKGVDKVWIYLSHIEVLGEVLEQ